MNVGLPTKSLDERAKLCVDTCLNVTAGETVVVVADSKHQLLADALVQVSRRRGAEPSVVTLPDPQLYEKEPPLEIARVIHGADVVFIALPPEFGCQFWHTDARQAASQAGARIGLVFPPATWDITGEDILATRQLTEALAAALDSANTTRVTTPAGTDVHMSVSGRRAFACHSILHRPGDTATVPDWGDAEISPVEGSAKGTVVIDGSMTFIGKVHEPIVLTVDAGRVVGIDGGVEAQRLHEILAGADANSRNIAEFGIGTVPRGEITGHKDDALLGTAHIALGHNVSLGGTVESNVHIDGVMRRPTIVLDGQPIINDGIVNETIVSDRRNNA